MEVAAEHVGVQAERLEPDGAAGPGHDEAAEFVIGEVREGGPGAVPGEEHLALPGVLAAVHGESRVVVEREGPGGCSEGEFCRKAPPEVPGGLDGPDPDAIQAPEFQSEAVPSHRAVGQEGGADVREVEAAAEAPPGQSR